MVNTNLKNAREKTGFTQVEVADKAQISETSYQRIEYGTQTPRLVTAQLIAKALHTTVEEIFPLNGRQSLSGENQSDTIR